jgi:hypothetical protein
MYKYFVGTMCNLLALLLNLLKHIAKTTKFLSGDKAAGAWGWPSILSTIDVKERVKIYLSSSSYGISRPVIR